MRAATHARLGLGYPLACTVASGGRASESRADAGLLREDGEVERAAMAFDSGIGVSALMLGAAIGDATLVLISEA